MRSFFSFIGILLVSTAILKLWAVFTDSFADVHIGLPRIVIYLLIFFELVIGIWNLAFTHSKVLALINTITFSTFTIAALAKFVMGVESCGCAGMLELPTWVFLLIDLSIMLGLLWNFKETQQGLVQVRSEFGKISSSARGQIIGFLIALSIFILSQFEFSKRLDELIVGKPQISTAVTFKEKPIAGQILFANVTIANNSPWPARFIGSQKSCNCVSTLQSIKMIEPNDKIEFEVRVSQGRRI